jgi:formylglycine-generating enzyme required for sulfatase activity
MEVANTVEWGTPVLYMSSSDGLLFRFTEPAKPIAVEKPAVSEPTSRVKAASQPASPSTPPRQETAAPTIPHSPLSFDWVTIPAGEFLMGSDKAKDKDAYDDELPQHKVNVAAFRIARTPVTVAQFAAFVKATQHKTTAEMEGYSWNWNGKEWAKIEGAFWRQPRGPESNVRQKADHPVTCVSWDDALAFCQWAQVRLPTEAEWEKAARGADGRIYPWGNEAPDDQRGNFDMKVGDTTAVGSYPRGASPYGLLDMAGNVWEWTSSPFKPYPYKAGDGREDPQSKEGRVLRGGAFLLEALYVRCAFRFRSAPDLRFDGIGFRVVSPGL